MGVKLVRIVDIQLVVNMTLKEKYLKQAKTFHGDKYDYSLWPEVITCRDKVEIICPIHGRFMEIDDSKTLML